MHEKGHLTVSFGGFFSHAFFYEAGTETYGELTGDYASDTSDLKDYTDVGVTLFLSVGYFLIDGWELGVQGSGMATWYPDGNQSDLAIYDVGGYTKVFFDNASAFTPYVGFKGGANWLGMDDYAEHDTTLGGLAGLEVYGTGPYSFFLEWTSVVTLNGGDSVGTEWRNQLYVGITWYWNLFPKPEPAE
ncbi:MAG: hypothetical protein JXR37_15755 [Kiritimatiellae bacterium]|nr:hypothetical protein [Kiritimatiellia bacterium]